MIRPGGARDVPFLRDMLRHAFYWRTPVGEEEPPLTRYVTSWGRPGDRSLIAIDELVPVGAAWYRLFKQADAGFGFVDEQTPELAIAVVPSRRGRGFGHELLSGLLERAREDGFDAISLSVARDNPAVALYERYGFERVREDDGAFVMLAPLADAS
jgi:ribosomal protein S18 acetylase RimI-like enzyme